jgi:iron-sulfur cluster assembly protein
MALTVTERAAQYAKGMIAKRGAPTAGIRLGVKGGGCSGLLYVLEYCDQPAARDRTIDVGGVKFFVDPKSDLHLSNAVLDFVTEKLQAGLKFVNPQEKESCGCGVSFNV